MSQRMVHLRPTLDLPFLFEEWLSVQNFLHGIHKTVLGVCWLCARLRVCLLGH